MTGAALVDLEGFGQQQVARGLGSLALPQRPPAGVSMLAGVLLKPAQYER